MDKLKFISIAKRFVLSVYVLCFVGYAVSPLSLDLNQNQAKSTGSTLNHNASNSDNSDDTLRLLVGDLIANKLPHHVANKSAAHILMMKARALIDKIFILYRPDIILFAFLCMLVWSSAALLPVFSLKTKAQTGFRFECSGLSPPPSFF